MNIEKIISKIFKKRVIKRADGDLYLTRYYVVRKPVWWLPSIYIHCFHSSDHDLELHNHGWNKSLSILLKGSYSEEVREKDDTVSVRVLKAGNFNYITKNKFHRIDLLSNEVWSLFFSGTKKNPEWGFWDRDTKVYNHWEEHERIKKEQALINTPFENKVEAVRDALQRVREGRTTLKKEGARAYTEVVPRISSNNVSERLIAEYGLFDIPED